MKYIYASEATDSCGHDYYQCELDDNPDNHANDQCCIGGSDND